MLSRVKRTNAQTVRGKPTVKNNTEGFRNGLVRELKEKQGKQDAAERTLRRRGCGTN